jgi:hypothetical protein
MKKKLSFISIFSAALAGGFILEECLLSSMYSFMVPFAVFLVVLTIMLLASYVVEYVKTKDSKLLWCGILICAIFFKETWANLFKILHH